MVSTRNSCAVQIALRPDADRCNVVREVSLSRWLDMVIAYENVTGHLRNAAVSSVEMSLRKSKPKLHPALLVGSRVNDLILLHPPRSVHIQVCTYMYT